MRYHFWQTKIAQLYLFGVPRMVLLPLVYASNVHETHNRKDIATHDIELSSVQGIDDLRQDK